MALVMGLNIIFLLAFAANVLDSRSKPLAPVVVLAPRNIPAKLYRFSRGSSLRTYSSETLNSSMDSTKVPAQRTMRRLKKQCASAVSGVSAVVVDLLVNCIVKYKELRSKNPVEPSWYFAIFTPFGLTRF